MALTKSYEDTLPAKYRGITTAPIQRIKETTKVRVLDIVEKRSVLAGAIAAGASLAVAVGAFGQAPAAAPPKENAPAAGQPAPGGPPPGDPLGPDLFIAIRSGTTADVKALLAKGAQVEATNWLGFTPLMWAAVVGNRDACAVLLDAGAKVDAASHYGTSLTFAEEGGNPAVVRLLL